MFLKDNKWVWLDQVFQNVYNNDNDNNEGIIALQRCYIQLIDVLVVLTKNNDRSNFGGPFITETTTQSEDKEFNSETTKIIVNKDLITNLLVDVFNQKKYDVALKKVLEKTFDEYRQYLYDNKGEKKREKKKEKKGGDDDQHRDNKLVTNDRYIVYKINVLQDLISKSSNKELLNKWDQLILKLRKL